MKFRLVDDAETGEWLSYDGIRSTDKLKQFLLTDLLTAFVYSRVSNRFHSSSVEGEEYQRRLEEHRDMVSRIARAFSLDYLGMTEGTPADQVSRRVANMIAALDGREQPKQSAAATVKPEQLLVARGFVSGKGAQMSVRSSPQFGDAFDGAAHIPASKACGWIVDMLTDCRGNIHLQSIMRLQHETMLRVLGGERRTPDDISLSCTRMYLALRCILRPELQSVGDVYEPMLSLESLKEVIPTIPPGPELPSPVVLAFGRSVALAEALSHAQGPLFGAPVLRCLQDETDIGVQLYKARVLRDYGRSGIVIVSDGDASLILDQASSEIRRMGWEVTALITVFPDRRSSGYHICTEGKSPTSVTEDLRCLVENGSTQDDGRLLSMLCGTYADFLTLGYPELGTTPMDPGSGMGVIADRYSRTLRAEPAKDCGFRPLVLAVRSMIIRHL